MDVNARRATPERALWLFTAFLALALVATMKDRGQRTELETLRRVDAVHR